MPSVAGEYNGGALKAETERAAGGGVGRMGKLKAKEYKRFENIKHIRADGSEYWLARELALVLDYAQWRNFAKVIGKAMIACRNSGHDVVCDFVEVSKIVDAGVTSKSSISWEARSL